MDEDLTEIVALLALAMMVAIVARRLKLPYTVGLVAMGCALTFSKLHIGQHLTHDLIFDLILPPLLFEAALAIHWRDLWRDLPPILTLSTLGAAFSAAAVAAGMIFILHWPFVPAVVFGSLIAATDPVAIIAMFKDNKLEGRLRLLVESESLLNDGAAAVLFGLSLEWALSGGAAQPGMSMLATLAQTVAGGIAVGAVFAGLAIQLTGRTSDHLVEAALTSIAAFGSFLIAEHFHASGVLATVAAGLIMGNLGVLEGEKSAYISVRGRQFVIELWEFAAFVANSLVFLLIGVDAAQMPFSTYDVKNSRHRARRYARRSRAHRLSHRFAVHADALGDAVQDAAYPLVGRPARRAFARPGAFASAHAAAARRYSLRHFRDRGFLIRRPGSDHAAAAASIWFPSGVRKICEVCLPRCGAIITVSHLSSSLFSTHARGPIWRALSKTLKT